MLSRHSAVKRGNFSAIVVAGRAFTRAENRQNALVEVRSDGIMWLDGWRRSPAKDHLGNPS